MKFVLFIAFLTATAGSALAQQPLRYTVWIDGLLNPQLPKSSLYAVGAGVRGEVSKPLRHPAYAFFAQVGYAHFFQKTNGAFTADAGLLTVGGRYQSRRFFNASVGVGGQYRTERMRVGFADGVVAETFTHVIPSATVGIGARLRSRYRVGLENRILFKPEPGGLILRNNVALSVGYTL